MRICRILLLGFGHVAQRFCELLSEKPGDHPQLERLGIRCIGIFTGCHGAWVDSDGIDLPRALGDFRINLCFPSEDERATRMRVSEAVDRLDYDVLVELSTLSIEDRGEPALSFVKGALRRGRHVVTANKGPAAFALRELEMLSTKHQAHFRYESSVLDGFPVFNLRRYCLGASCPERLEGILNCTSNFVLSQGLENGDWESALREAQAAGFAEADARLDLEGWDSAAKIAILANTFLEANMTPLDVPREEVNARLIQRLADSRRPGDCWRIVARAWGRGSAARARVDLKNLPPHHPLRTLSPASGGLVIETDLTGPLFFAQRDPSLTDTAYGIIQDLWEVWVQSPATGKG